jgi:hypothetical protein
MLSAFWWLLILLVADPPTVLSPQPPAESPAEVAAEKVTEAESTLTADQRRDVLEAADRTLRRRAFVVGIDFAEWRTRLPERQDAIDDADTPEDLIRVVNVVLAEFKVSHLRLSKPSAQTPRPSRGSREVATTQSTSQPSGTPNQTLDTGPSGSAVLKLRSFDDGAYDRAEMERLVAEASKAPAIILDLRGNSGGAVGNLAHCISLFVREGTSVGVYVTRETARAFERERGTPPASAVEAAAWTTRKFTVRRNPVPVPAVPLAVLVSRSSASASEIVAAALRDHANAAVVGQPTAGKVLLSTHARLPHGFELQIPTADYVTTKGVRLEGSPIRPHIQAPTGRAANPQDAVRAAAGLLLEGL